MKRRRNILPVTYFPHRKRARKTNAKVPQPNSPAYNIPQINDVNEIQTVAQNNDQQMAQVERIQSREVNEIHGSQNGAENNDIHMTHVEQNDSHVVQNLPGNNGLQIVQSKRIDSHEAELLNELDHSKKVVAKREKEMKQYEHTIQNLQSLLGAEDLTEDALNTYDDILMSNENIK